MKKRIKKKDLRLDPASNIKIKRTNYNFKKPPIPNGYRHVEGKWSNGFVIERNSDGSQFVWIPIAILNNNGTRDGIKFDKKFGRRKYNDFCEFSQNGYHELIDKEHLKSVKKYHGFYISRYEISKSKNEKPLSIAKGKKWCNVTALEARNIASMMEKTEQVTSHLMYGSEYDSIMEWIRNYDKKFIVQKIPEGGIENLEVNNIYDLFSAEDVITQELYKESLFVTRGGEEFEVTSRSYLYFSEKYDSTTFRVALCIS